MGWRIAFLIGALFAGAVVAVIGAITSLIKRPGIARKVYLKGGPEESALLSAAGA